MKRLLEVDKATKSFGGVLALDNVSLTMDEGEILGVIGPNGAGKTTLFNLINGVIHPDAGSIRLCGEDITEMPPYRVAERGVARTHQIVKPLGDLTVLENVVVGGCFGRDKLRLRDAEANARHVLETVGLAHRAASLAGQLTIAGKKRLEVARALAGSPRLLLLDEVLAGLNPTEVGRMIEVTRKIRTERGLGILIIEHLMQAIMSLSDRVMVLNFGSMLAQGTPGEVAGDRRVVEAYLGDPDIAAKLAVRP